MESEAPMQSPVNLTGKVYLKGAACLAHVQAVHPAVTKSDLQSGLKTLMGSGSRDHLLTVIVPHAALSFHLAQYLSTRFLPATDDALSCKRWAKAMDERAVAIHSSLQRVERAPEVLVLDALLPRLLLLQKVTLKVADSKAEVTAFAAAIARVKNLTQDHTAITPGTADCAAHGNAAEDGDVARALPIVTLSHRASYFDMNSVPQLRHAVAEALAAGKCVVHRLEFLITGATFAATVQMTPATIDSIARMSSLQEIDLTGTPLHDDETATRLFGAPGDRSSPSKLPNLRRLNLSRTRAGPACLEAVAALPSLTALTIWKNVFLEEPVMENESDAPLPPLFDSNGDDIIVPKTTKPKAEREGFLSRFFSNNEPPHPNCQESPWAVLRHATKLRHLDIEGSSISPEGLHAVMHIRTLETLFLGDVAPAVVEAVAGHPTLSTLSLNTIGLSQRLLDIIVGLPSLTSLSLYGLQIRDADLSGISRARDLKVFRAVGSPLRSAGLLALSDLRCLGELSVDVCPGDDAVLAELIPNMTSLRKIDVRGEQLCSTARAIKGRYPMLRRVVSNGERHRCFMES